MVVGLTGGICTGKSVAMDALRAAGHRVLDCDEIARYLTDYDPLVRGAILAQFGPGVFHANGALVRRELGRLAFADEENRRRLERILHPGILQVLKLNIAAARAAHEPLIAVVPLLFELGLETQFDETWLTTCAPEVQLERLCRRSGLPPGEAQRWIDAQWPQERKQALATRILPNDATIDSFKQRVVTTAEAAFSA